MRTQSNVSIPMYRFLFVLFIGILLSSCNSPEDKAKSLIKQNLKESLHDWDSYESVKFGSLDSVYTTIEDNRYYLECYAKLILYNKKGEEVLDEIKIYDDLYSSWADNKRRKLLTEAKEYIDSINKYQLICKQLNNDFKPEFSGWKIQHSYRCNNALGNKIISHYMYYFNKDITEIVKQEDVSDSAQK